MAGSVAPRTTELMMHCERTSADINLPAPGPWAAQGAVALPHRESLPC